MSHKNDIKLIYLDTPVNKDIFILTFRTFYSIDTSTLGTENDKMNKIDNDFFHITQIYVNIG